MFVEEIHHHPFGFRVFFLALLSEETKIISIAEFKVESEVLIHLREIILTALMLGKLVRL